MIFSLTLAAALNTPSPAPTPQSLRVVALHAPKATLRVQVADTEPERELGLMWVRRLPPHTGMVFVFPKSGPQEFWMKDTLVPLDMVFVAADGTVTSVAKNVPVVSADAGDNVIPRRSGTGRYVIELPANEAAADGLAPGAHIGGLPKNAR